MKKLSWLAVLAVMVLPALAHAQGSSLVAFGAVGGGRVVSTTTLPASASGALVVSFHGDPATGCAQRGLCGYSGTIVLHPGATAIGVVESRGRRGAYQVSFLPGFGDQATLTLAHVERASPGGRSGLCADAVQPNSMPSSTSTAGLVRLSLVQRNSSVLTTRCAGPIDADVASAVPTVVIPVKKLLKGHLALGLPATHGFAANGFAGTVSSTVVIHVGAPHHQASGGFTKIQRTRAVTETLSLVRQSGQFVAFLRGSGNPAICQPLDSCGLSGTITIAPGFAGAQATLTAIAPAARPHRDFLAALGLSRQGNSRGIAVYGAITSLHGGSVTADLTLQSGSCMDSVPLEDNSIGLFVQGGAVGAIYLAPSLRTRCPGPSPSYEQLAVGRIGRGVLERREITLTLHPQHSFSDDGYVASMRGSISLVLRRGRVS